MVNSQEIKEKFNELRLKSCSENFDRIMAQAIQKNWTPAEIIEILMDLELEHKRQNRMALRYKNSKLVEKPTIDQFDFSHHQSRKKQKAKILNLMSLEF
ncbi:transposition helper protein, insertion sequence IS5376 putative ATP-binding protein, partial [Candidatus Magnetomorum sp. HK-1]